MKIGEFAKVKRGALAKYGIGKIYEVAGDVAKIGFFDSPLKPVNFYEVSTSDLISITLSKHTRVYWKNPKNDNWIVGRVSYHEGLDVEVRFPNQNDKFINSRDLFIRWDIPLMTPEGYLAEKISESPILSDGRSRFVQSLLKQRNASMGMPGLLSSIIELETHQIEVVRRVLQDPIQRYLLADEVGLGKTIEAGVLIRQFILENEDNKVVLVIVPPVLVGQWRKELATKFILGLYLDVQIQVIASDCEELLSQFVPEAGMIVVDEAHHVSSDKWLYSLLSDSYGSSKNLLLLSATPALGNEKRFHEMLHLLDPLVFPLEEFSEFKKKINNRQSIAEIVAGLVPENLFFLDQYLDTLRNEFSFDPLLIEYIEKLQSIIEMVPDESDFEYITALLELKSHISETYKLNRRILRNRRKNVPGLTPDRGGAISLDYESLHLKVFYENLEEWRCNQTIKNPDNTTLIDVFFQILQSVISRSNMEELVSETLPKLQKSSDNEDQLLISNMINSLTHHFNEQSAENALIKYIADTPDDRDFVIFCSDSCIAQKLCEKISTELKCTNKLVSEDANLHLNSTERVLICDQYAEEGLNLQGGHKSVIHFDLPLSPNRLEQRIGRVDRYGTGTDVNSVTLRCTSSQYELAWLECLEKGFGVFERSIASLQYLVNDKMVNLKSSLFLDGIEAIDDLKCVLGGENGEVISELKCIDQQDALDSLIIPDEGTFDDLFDEDDRWVEFKEDVNSWLVRILLMTMEEVPRSKTSPLKDDPYRYVFHHNGGKETLIPLNKFLENFLPIWDTNTSNSNVRTPKSYPYVCRRQSALKHASNAEDFHLLRYGDTLLKGLEDLTKLDERGRSVAFWRERPQYTPESVADIFVRYDFIIETDSTIVTQTYADHLNISFSAAQRALQRKGDMVFPPYYQRIWVDENQQVVTDPNLISILEEPYNKIKDDTGKQDMNLNPERWEILSKFELPQIYFWNDFIQRNTDAARDNLMQTPELQEKIKSGIQALESIDNGRFSQLRSRIRHTCDSDQAREVDTLDFEIGVSSEFKKGISEPRITLDTISSIFLSNKSLLQVARQYFN